MTEAATHWFSPAPSEVTSSRISLDFDLRAADLFFRELVVPELGRIWFARQLSWPLAALALHEDLASQGSHPPKPTAICHGIEALACKLEYEYDPSPKTRSGRILGSRAFARDNQPNGWSFDRLRQATNYVSSNTHRQAATRALRVDGGLGFAHGTRFDLLKLEPIGFALANAFLEQRVAKGGVSLRKWLRGWIEGGREISGHSKTLLQSLSPEHVTNEECTLILSRLFGTATPAAEKRNRLTRAVGHARDLPSIEDGVVVRLRKAGHNDQANEVGAARAFGAMLDRARDAVASLTRVVEPARGGVRLAKLANEFALKKSIKHQNPIDDLRAASTNFVEKSKIAAVTETTSRAFANEVLAGDDPEVIRILVRRSGRVLGLADDAVVRGALFEKAARVFKDARVKSTLVDGAASIEPDHTGRTFRIANFHALIRDVRQGAR
jgi:hypothetical protein